MRFLSRYHSGNAETQQRFARRPRKEQLIPLLPKKPGTTRPAAPFSPFPRGSTFRVRVAPPKSVRSPFLLQQRYTPCNKTLTPLSRRTRRCRDVDNDPCNSIVPRASNARPGASAPVSAAATTPARTGKRAGCMAGPAGAVLNIRITGPASTARLSGRL